MTRFLAATFVVACFAQFIFAEDQVSERFVYQPDNPRALQEGERKGFVVEASDEEVFQRALDLAVNRQEASLRNEYLNLAREQAEQLSEAELRDEIERLKEQQAVRSKQHEKRKVANEVAEQLQDAIARFGFLAEGDWADQEARAYIEYMQRLLQTEVKRAKLWSEGKLNIPRGTVPAVRNPLK